MKSLRLSVKLLLSLVFFGLILRVVRGAEFSGMLRQIEPAYVGLSLLVTGAMVAASCWKWHVLLVHQGTPVPYRHLFRLYLIGYYFTSLMPSNVGGDVARSYYVGKRIGSQSDAAVSVLLERVSGLVLLLALVVGAPMLRPALYAEPAVMVFVLASLVGLLILGLLAWSRQPLRQTAEAIRAWRQRSTDSRLAAGADRIVLRVRERALRFHGKLGRALRGLARDPSMLWAVAGLTVLFYALTWLNVYVSFRAFGVALPFRDVAAVVPVCMMVSMIPVAPLASLGLAEGAYVFFFRLLGVPPAASLAMGLLLRCKLLLVGLIGCGVYLAQGERIAARGQRNGHE